MTIEAIGCCGAYCGTCKELKAGTCKGCKFGYITGERDIDKARCKMKACCIKKHYNTCADCQDFLSCPVISEFYSKNGYKYKKYKQALEYIRDNGYASFLKIADSWNGAYGKYK
ncbi:DUF3795 domain-containing protein [Methanosarcina sp. T3]|uniref:DUF3795 domain-containing protein n=1 Tax=Methanosarcina sp. T3 TaxID=3439062 RepID=UPI003F863BE8